MTGAGNSPFTQRSLAATVFIMMRFLAELALKQYSQEEVQKGTKTGAHRVGPKRLTNEQEANL